MKRNTSKRRLKVNILVMRVNKKGDICNSKPCCNCIKKMEKFEEYKNIKIDKIFYSGDFGIIEKHSLKSIKTLPKHVSLAFRKE
jgi:hypothetical protein